MARKLNQNSDLSSIKEPRFIRDRAIPFIRGLFLVVTVLAVLALIVLGAFRGINDPAFLFDTTLYVALFIIALIVFFTAVNILHRWIREIGDRRSERDVKDLSTKVRNLIKKKAPLDSWYFLRDYFYRFEIIKASSEQLTENERKTLKESLRKINVKEYLEDVAIRSDYKWKRVDAILLIGWVGAIKKQDLLRRALYDPDADIRYAACHALSDLDTRESYNYLLEALHLDHLSKSRVATFLENSNYKSKYQILTEEAGMKDPKIRFWSAYLLGKLGDKRAFNLLKKLTADKSPDVRANAIVALAELGDKKAVYTIKRLFDDEVWFVRAHAAKAAEKLNDRDLLEDSLKLLRDPNWWVREDASRAIEKQGKRAIPFLEKFLTDSDHFARNMAAELLVRLGEVEKRIREIPLGGPTSREAKVFLSKIGSAEAADYIGFQALSESPSTQKDLIGLVGDTGDEHSLDTLKELEKSKDPRVKELARSAIKNIERRSHG